MKKEDRDEDWEKTMQELTSAKNLKEDAELLMMPYFNIEQLLLPVPFSIYIMGMLSIT